MKRSVLALLVILLLIPCMDEAGAVERKEEGNLVTEGIPDIPQSVIDRMVQYNNTRGASLSSWKADGKGIFIATRFGETSQIHFVEKAGGTRKQITFFKEPVANASVCPDKTKNAFLFGKDVGGGEFYQIFYFDVQTGKYRMLTDGESRNGGYLWSNKGDRFAYYTTRRNGRDWDIYIADPDDPENATPILEKGGVWFPGDWSPDDRSLIVGRYVSANESYGYILDIETGELTQINPSEEKIAYGQASWTRDGTGIFYTSDEDSEFMHLRFYDIESGESDIVTKDIEWDVGGFAINHDGDALAFITNEDGISVLYLMDTADMSYKKVPGLPVGGMGGMEFSPDDKKLALTLDTPRTTGDVYMLDMKEMSLERWTYSEIGGLDTDSFPLPKLVHYETFDKDGRKKREIPAFYFRPAGEGPYPVLIYIHGGPEGQYTPYFSSYLQYIINEMGIAVIAPNVRGSAGYGKSYLKLDNGFKREDSVKDIGALLDWIELQPELDTSKVCVYGGSYGGYMVYASMIHYNDRLRCGIDVVGISNFVTFLENTKEYRQDLRRAEYGDERDAEMRKHLLAISPTTNAHRITKPMFIIQGLNDPRVPASEAEQMLEAIRKNGVEAWYLLAKDEGHGFRKKKNRDYMVHSIILFLDEFLQK